MIDGMNRAEQRNENIASVRLPESARRPGRLRPVWLAAVLLLVIASGCQTGGHRTGAPASTNPASTNPASTNPAPTTASTATPSTSSASGGSATTTAAAAGAASLQQAFVAVVAKVRPQVVEISTTEGLGSGVTYDTNGDIVTNDHVVGSATSFEVQLINGQKLSASLVGAYPPDDLAVIRVNGARKLTPATFGDSRALQVGDIVFAVGNPLGLASSVTEGIVSYNGRAVSEGNGVELPSTIQTSAPINPGNSGGALVDLAGEVIGIPTLAAVDQQEGGAAAGIGFAIPASTVKQIVPQLIATGHVTSSGRAALGIAGADAVDAVGNPAGVIVSRVQRGGAAAKAGIVAGDVITGVNGQPVTSLADLQNILAGLAPGSVAKVTVVAQDGGRRTVNATLGELSS
jgi:S1-C subfamily serine protease